MVLVAVALAGEMGCAKVTLTTSCPVNSTGVSFALAGSTVGNQAIAMLGAVASGAKVMAGPTSTGTSATMTYEYLPIFGADSGSLDCTQPPIQTVVVTSPPAQVVSPK
jgi:hypothetical protein